MMTTLRHRTARQLALLLTVGAVIALCLAALACGPAAPAGHGGTSGTAIEPAIIPMATSSATPTGEAAWDGDEWLPTPTLTRMQRQYHPTIGDYFIHKIQQYEAAANGAGDAKKPASSGQSAPTPETSHLVINVDAHKRVDEVQRFLEESGASQIKCMKFPSDYIVPGQCGAVVSISRLRALADQPGVIEIKRMVVLEPASELRSPHLQQSVADAHGITAWRLAGIGGVGNVGGNDSRFWRAVAEAAR